MKKRSKILASLVLAGTMVLGLAGCGDSGSANGGTQSGKNSGAKYQVGVSASSYSTRLSMPLQRALRTH